MINYEKLFIASTDTVVGIGGPISEDSQESINTLKKSPLDKRLIIMVSSIEMAEKFYKDHGFDERAKTIASGNWPGAVTLVISDTLALRVPGNAKLRKFIEKEGKPIYMTSANVSGEKPLSFSGAIDRFVEIKTHHDFGEGSGKPSTIIDVRDRRVIRE